MKKLKTAVIGTGFVGAAHVETIRRLGNIEIVAVAAGRNSQQKAHFLYIDKGYDDYKEMIDTEKPDAVHICTPNDTHYEIAMYAMQKGVNVLCEKPMTVSIEQAKEMTELAEKNNIVNAINFQNRLYPMVNQMKNMIADGELGKIYSIHGGYLQDWLLYDSDFNWRLISEKGGKTRTVGDIGSHWLDIAEYVTGLRVTELIADFSIFHKQRKRFKDSTKTFSGQADENAEFEMMDIDTEDYVSLMLRFDNGAVGSAVLTQMFAGKKNKISVFVSGSEKSLEWDTDDLSNIIIGNRSEPNQILTKDPALLHPLSRKLSSYPGGHMEGYPDAFKQVFKEFYEKIENKDAKTSFGTFKDGLRQMVLAEKIYESAMERKWVSVD